MFNLNAEHIRYERAAQAFDTLLPQPKRTMPPIPEYPDEDLRRLTIQAYDEGRDPATDPEITRLVIGTVLASEGVFRGVFEHQRNTEQDNKVQVYKRVLPKWHAEAQAAAETVTTTAAKLPGANLKEIMNGPDARRIAVAAPAVHALTVLGAWEKLLNDPTNGNADHHVNPARAHLALFNPSIRQYAADILAEPDKTVWQLVQAGWELDPATDTEAITDRIETLNQAEDRVQARMNSDVRTTNNFVHDIVNGGANWAKAFKKATAAGDFD